ncbi:MAG: peptidylprolyl isomerase [Bacteroidales bacterium]|nr:peptidylprolyl isomerase [Bacteroidales bacterium]
MIIEKGKVVSVLYELRLADGSDELIEKVNESRPLQYLQGHGNLLPKFEAYLEGLTVGDTFDFVLKSEEAYGPISNEAIVDVPISVFEVDGKIDEELLTIGNVIPMMDNQGNRFNGKVLEVTLDNVKMDFNHPLAGADLHFTGRVLEIREATPEELMHGHIHQTSSGCSCGGGCSCATEPSESDSCGCGCN